MQLKLSIIAATFFIILSFSSLAQSTVNFGVKGGVNFSAFLGNDAYSSSLLTGPHFGGLAQIALSENDEGFVRDAFQAEAIYSVQGSKDESDQTTLSYLNVPLTVQRYFWSSGFYLETGLQAGFLLSAKAKDAEGTINVKKQFNSVDLGLIFGLGYKFNSGLGINTRFTKGLSPLSSGYDAKNVTIGLGLFYVFGQKNED
jgi:hypothetical protein